MTHPYFDTPIKITTLTGHLTAVNKRAIAEMLKRGMTDAKVNRITYHITGENPEYTVRTEQNSTNDWGTPIIDKSKATFKTNK